MDNFSVLHPLLTRYEKLFMPGERRALLQQMSGEIQWQTDFVVYGRRFDMPRRQAWFADEGVHYRYSDNMLTSQLWVEPLLLIKNAVERKTGLNFNSVLVTYYRDGSDHVAWHADDEVELGDKPVIASLSFGATRQFHYRHKLTGDTGRMELHDGELILMQAGFQEECEHCVPVELDVVKPRMNLTFRNVVMLRELDSDI